MPLVGIVHIFSPLFCLCGQHHSEQQRSAYLGKRDSLALGVSCCCCLHFSATAIISALNYDVTTVSNEDYYPSFVKVELSFVSKVKTLKT